MQSRIARPYSALDNTVVLSPISGPGEWRGGGGGGDVYMIIIIIVL